MRLWDTRRCPNTVLPSSNSPQTLGQSRLTQRPKRYVVRDEPRWMRRMVQLASQYRQYSDRRITAKPRRTSLYRDQSTRSSDRTDQRNVLLSMTGGAVFPILETVAGISTLAWHQAKWDCDPNLDRHYFRLFLHRKSKASESARSRRSRWM